MKSKLSKVYFLVKWIAEVELYLEINLMEFMTMDKWYEKSHLMVQICNEL